METLTAPRRPTRLPQVCILAAWLLAPLAVGQAATVTVGNGGCQYIGLQFALDELESQPGPHTLKLKSQTIAIPNGLVLDTASTSYTFIGGHASCSDANPAPGQRTVLDASGGNLGTAFAINGTSSTSTPTVRLRGVTVRGGSAEGGPFDNPEGGGLEIRGRVSVHLDARTRIEENATGKGGGVFIRGDNASERAELWILGGSSIDSNTAQTEGGGIYCADHATVYHDSGEITLNVAQDGLGGGALLENHCRYDAFVSGDFFTGFNANSATDGGGGLFVRGGNADVQLNGAQTNPFWFVGNTNGGLLVINGDNSNPIDIDLLTTVFMANTAPTTRDGAALSVNGNVNATLRPAVGHSGCSFLGVPHGACSAVIGNTGTGPFTFGGVMLVGGGFNPSPVAALTVRDTAIVNNEGLAILDAWYRSRLDVQGSVIRNNRVVSSISDVPAVFRLRRDGTQAADSRLAWSTVIDNTTGTVNGAVLDHESAGLDVTGSILHNPGLVGRTTDSDGTLVHGGCLLLNSGAGFPTSPLPPVVAPHGLQSNLTPGPASAALDRCSTAGIPVADFRGNSRAVDQPAIPNAQGPVDIGAIERPLDPLPEEPLLRVYWDSSLIADGSTSTVLTDLGSMSIEGGSVFRDFSVRNEGGETLTINGHSVSGACAHNFAVDVIAPSIAPGGQGVARLVFDPVDEGVCEADYQIVSNDAGSPYTFRVRGTGVGPDLFANGFE